MKILIEDILKGQTDGKSSLLMSDYRVLFVFGAGGGTPRTLSMLSARTPLLSYTPSPVIGF